MTIGTEVSAKFKGAFCEAKIKHVDKLVKCKVTYKSNGQQATVVDELIRLTNGNPLHIYDFKIGMLINVLNEPNGDISTSRLGTLNKIMDQSSYTVIFNDGDEKVVRRSFIRFKGERHYLDSETLNNAPLNNPEHFLYPIKSEAKASSLSKLSPLSIDTKRTNSNNSVITDDDSLDLFYEEKKKNDPTETGPLLKIKKVKSDDEDNDEEDAESGGASSSNTSDEDSSSSSSEDCPSEVKDRFVAQLYKFMDDRGTSMNRVPAINNTDIDLHRLYTVVRRYGGYNKVNEANYSLNFPNISNFYFV